MKILIVDDNEVNRAAARAQLSADHDLTVSDSCGEAVEKLQKQEFDVVLTDLMLLDGPGRYGNETEIGSGIWLALIAASRGVKLIGVLTDTTHHGGWEARAAVELGKKDNGHIVPSTLHIQGARCLVCTAETEGVVEHFHPENLSRGVGWPPLNERVGLVKSKNWAALLERLLSLSPV